jgi:glucose-6-phosphate 1-epimerase
LSERTGVQGTDLIALETPEGHRAEVSLWGGQVLSWAHAVHGEQLYCSPLRQPGQAIRGGVPVCFPQFASRGPLAKHGFARTSMWRLEHRSCEAGVARARLGLVSSDDTQMLWPHDFSLTLDVELSPTGLALALRVENTGHEPWPFTVALHTYLRLSDVARASLHGLEGVTYEDACRDNEVALERHPHVSIDGEVDRVYRAAPTRLLLVRAGQPALEVLQSGFADTVVWNPGPIKAAALADLPDTDWQHMLCIEAAQVARPILLAPGMQWLGHQRLALIEP